LALPSELAEAVVKRLTLFRFRSKVDLKTSIAEPGDLGQNPGESFEAWLQRQFDAGIAEIREPQSEEFTPHMLNLDLLGAVSFDKGCYTGQEIVARTHYRGATRRRMLRYGVTGPAAPGDKLLLGERPVGEVVNVLGDELLAVAPLDDADAGLTVNAGALDQRALPYF
jgi:folate-binding protein YgfZ